VIQTERRGRQLLAELFVSIPFIGAVIRTMWLEGMGDKLQGMFQSPDINMSGPF
jgi:hypothetical protein